jgi:large subunit ribosomal protein L18
MCKCTSREKIKKRINSRIKDSGAQYCVTVFKSNTAIYCSIIDIVNNKVLTSISSRTLYKDSKNCNKEKAKNTGIKVGEKLKELKLNNVVFNRNGYLYHGKVESLVDGIRSVGIKI